MRRAPFKLNICMSLPFTYKAQLHNYTVRQIHPHTQAASPTDELHVKTKLKHIAIMFIHKQSSLLTEKNKA